MFADNIVQKVSQIAVAHDWYEALRSGCRSFWVSCSSEGQKTLYGEVKCGGDPTQLTCTKGFEVNLVSKDVLSVQYPAGHLTSYFFAPCNVFSDVHTKAVRCLDVSPGGGLAVTCGDDEGLYVWQTDNGNVRRRLEGHVNDVTRCRFFPSGSVVLTGGVDMRLKIWSVEDGSCPVTLVGHKGAITGMEIVERGRNIISCSRDGSAILWDCGTAQLLSTLKSCTSIINTCSLSQYRSQLGVNPNNSEQEFGTEGKLLLLGKDDGYLDAIDLSSKESVFCVPCYSPVNACCFVDENNIAVGLQDGKIAYYDVRNTRSPHQICKHGKASINCLQSFHGDSILIGRGDGSSSCVRVNESHDVVTMEMCGSNCDPVFDISCHENYVYTTCRDSNIRKYELQLDS